MAKCEQKCEVWSRIVGYFRPTKDWNKAKKEEFSIRKTFDLSELTQEVKQAEAQKQFDECYQESAFSVH